MDKKELEQILLDENFDPDCYSLDEEQKDEALSLRRDGDTWCVYYSERGLQSEKEYFADEASACEYFLAEMRDDPTTKVGWKSGFSM